MLQAARLAAGSKVGDKLRRYVFRKRSEKKGSGGMFAVRITIVFGKKRVLVVKKNNRKLKTV